MGDNRSHSADSSWHICRERPTASRATSTSRPTWWSARSSCCCGRATTSRGCTGPTASTTCPTGRRAGGGGGARERACPEERPCAATPASTATSAPCAAPAWCRSPAPTRPAAAPAPGPLVAGAAILPDTKAGIVPGLADSKLLTEKARERCYDQIVRRALAWSVVVIDSEECDRLGMHVANVEALRRAVALLDVAPDYVLTDGFPVDGLGVPGPGDVEGRPRRRPASPPVRCWRRSPATASCARCTSSGRRTTSGPTRATSPTRTPPR